MVDQDAIPDLDAVNRALAAFAHRLFAGCAWTIYGSRR
jgi:hypothetical protein